MNGKYVFLGWATIGHILAVHAHRLVHSLASAECSSESCLPSKAPMLLNLKVTISQVTVPQLSGLYTCIQGFQLKPQSLKRSVSLHSGN